jgi:surface protein
LPELDLSKWETTSATNMSQMFCNCKVLTKLDIRNFTFTKVTNYSNMFKNVPADCLIIVKDDTAKTWITSKFTTLTNVKTVAELG